MNVDDFSTKKDSEGRTGADKAIAEGDYSFLNKGGLLKRPKRKNKK